jgi:CheY-like chemotaxis protein
MAYKEFQLVGEANDGEDAVELCEIIHPDIVLMDVKMPRMDGITATRRIHRRWPDIRVLILTSLYDVDTFQLAQEAGASGFILKDVDAEELASEIINIFQNDLSQAAKPPSLPLPGSPKAPDSPRTQQELISAGKIQASILPNATPQLPGWEFAAGLRSARETSGDFFDFIPLSNGNLGLVIADVTDKGIGAALYMALSNTLIRTYAAQYPTLPAFALGQVNRRILSDTHGNMFVSVFYAVLEPDTGRMRYTNAGHNPPLLISTQKGKPIDRLRGTGMALGVEENTSWKQKITKFKPGDVLVLYTDGITDASASSGDYYGDHRLLDVVRSRPGCSASALRDLIYADVNRFTGNSPLQDDMTLMVIRRK